MLGNSRQEQRSDHYVRQQESCYWPGQEKPWGEMDYGENTKKQVKSVIKIS